jgi:hypothetical protein
VKLVFNGFGGIMPALEPAKLPEVNAVQSDSVKHQRGNLMPYLRETTFQSPTDNTQNINSIHRIGTYQWLAWAGDVSVARGPMPMQSGENFDKDFRIYFAGDGVQFITNTLQHVEWPAFTTRRRALSNPSDANFENPWFGDSAFEEPMGVPFPGYDSNVPAKPTVTLGAPPTGTITQVTKGNPATFTMSAEPSPAISSGARIRFSGFPGSGDGSALNGATYPVSKISPTVYRIDGFDSSSWAATLTGTFTWTRAYDELEVEDRIYCFTYVDQHGQESKPGQNSDMVSVGEGQSVTVATPINTVLGAGSAGPTFSLGGSAKKRIYRSATGDTFNFLFIAEVAVTDPSFVDNLGDSVLGEALVTQGYDLPPKGLRSLVNHPNGFMCGAVNNEAHFSIPYSVYAWPTRYRKVLPNKIVGIGIYGSVLVYCTDANPVLAYATDPGAVSWRTLEVVYPCLSRRTIASSGEAVFYVSPAGLIMCSDSGAQNVTRGYWNDDQWRELVTLPDGTAKPMKGEWLNDSYWLTIDNATCLRLQFKGQGIINAGEFKPWRSPTAGAGYSTLVADSETGEMFGMRYSAGTPSDRVLELIDNRQMTVRIPMNWTSRQVVLPREMNFGAVQVLSPEPTVGTVTMTCIPDASRAPFEISIPTDKPVRLPAGFLTGTWQFKLTSTREISAVHFASTVGELREIAL